MKRKKNDTAIDPALLSLLATLPLTASSSQFLELLYGEALEICKQDIPGNFVQLSLDNPASALVLAWVVSRNTRQPRILFAPRPVLEKYGEQLEGIGGVSIRAVDEFLNDGNNATNWLGMIAFMHVGKQQANLDIFTLFTLLENQFTEKSSVLFGDADAIHGLHRFMDCFTSLFSFQLADNRLLLRCHRNHEPNSAIPVELVEEFQQDDPVTSGVFTLMSANERFQLYFAARCLLPLRTTPVRFIEVGSFAGGTFYEFCKAMQRHGLPYQGIAVEPCSEPQFIKVLDLFKDNAVHLQMLSDEAAPLLANYLDQDKLPELILIDGDHRFEAVCRDIQDYYPLLAPGGIMLFHDYLPPGNAQNDIFIDDRKSGHGPSVGEACRELLEGSCGLDPLDLPLLYPSNPVQSLACQPIIPGVFSTVRAYRKPKV